MDRTSEGAMSSRVGVDADCYRRMKEMVRLQWETIGDWVVAGRRSACEAATNQTCRKSRWFVG